ncbi:MAG: MFS transporter [archaeon]|nr:MFS transporter [archaeon]
MENKVENVNQINNSNSKLIMTSYSVGNTVGDLIAGVMSVMLFSYYETEVGLNTILTGVAMIIFAIWDGLNDPIVGYISDRPFPFTKKLGRRFPWIVGIFIPMLFFFVLIFYPPLALGEFAIFIWLIVTTCVFDTLESIFTINYFGLFPDKFRENSERLTASAIGTYFMIIGVVLGGFLPTIIIVFGDMNSYILMAWITVVINLICFPFLIPGVRDDKAMVNHFVENYRKPEKESFLSTLLKTLKQRNFSAFMVITLFYYTLSSSISSSLFYYARYVLNSEATVVSQFMISMFGAALLGVLFWYLYARKTKNNKNILIMAGLILSITSFLLTFIPDITLITLDLFFWGIGLGGFLTYMIPAFSEVLDENVLMTKQRNEGLLGGFRFLVTNLSRVITSIILMIVHVATGFVEGSDFQPDPAIFGVKLHTGAIPAILFLIGIIIFWKFYDITPKKAEEIKLKLKELNLE